MTRMIISPRQLKAINEIVTAVATTNSPVNAITTLNSLPNSNVDAKKVRFNNNAGGPDYEITNQTELSKVPNDAGSVSMSTNNNNTNSTGVFSESRFSKRQVELGRMLEMRRTGKVFSKKQLNEMFMETQENAKRLRKGIGKCKLNDIFDAIEEIFPEEIDGVKDVFMNGADLPEYICSIFSNDDVNGEKEEMFLERLGIKK